MTAATPRTIVARRSGALWLTAAGLLMVSGGLQLLAAVQRWIVVSGEWSRDDISVEDHRFDYIIPADPWENVGVAAQLHGLGLLALAAALGVMALVAARADRRIDAYVAAAVAAAFGLDGVHAFVSALLGFPSPMQYVSMRGIVSGVAAVCLVILAARWMRWVWPSSIALGLLVAVTIPGYLVAAFLIAPALVGYQSHDTTPWTEAVGAVATVVAGAVLAFAAAVRPRT